MTGKIIKKIGEERIKAVLLDLDNTLYAYAPCHKRALRSSYDYVKKVLSANKRPLFSYNEFLERYKKAQTVIKKNTRHQAASHSRFLYFQAFFESYFQKTMIDETITCEAIYWENFFKSMKLKKAAREFLKELKKKEVKVCIITNLTAKIQFEKIKHLNLQDYVDFIVSSEEVGREKPHRVIFLKALHKLNLSAKDLIMVGDDKECDEAGAGKLGISYLSL